MTALSSSYCIIMDHAINAPGNGNIVVGGTNATDKNYLREKMELIGKLASNDTSMIGIIPSSSKDVSVKFEDQCIQNIKNKEKLNGIEGNTKIQKRE